ncbi:MAG: phosphoserine phosphatase [Pseudonocardiales bacterium]|jgi:broad specificity phosphatase PhoE|nr:phosphoglycerate mutase [Mycobacterium sp.]MDT4979419.1 phosphoserine phosphatase [Pseudonocardiales bacterium]
MTEQLIAPTGLLERAEPSTCRLFLIRHGTTTMNVENRYRGRRDVPLDAQGYQDAVDAARQLSKSGLSAVYTGPLRRTIATAQIIADETRVPDLRILHGLNNVDYGVWEGMTSDEAAHHDPEAFALYRSSPHLAVCPAGERLTDAQQRIIAALHLIGQRHAGETVAAVTHAVMIRLVVAKLNGSAGEGWRIPVGRGSLTVFHASNDSIALQSLPEGDDVD